MDNIGIIGYGTVGSTIAKGLTKISKNKIFVYDIDKDKIKNVKDDRTFICENIRDLTRISDIIFVCVPTPSKNNGSIDLSIVDRVLREISFIKEKKIIVIKSTIIPGTTKKYQKKYKNKIIVYNPEFITEKNAEQNFLNPDRIVIGADDEDVIKKLCEFYEKFDCPIIKTDSTTAEMIKYASNSFLTTKVSFVNQIHLMCKKLGINSKDVMRGVVLDKRIHPSHTEPGRSWRGKCLPKDLQAIIKKGEEIGCDVSLLKAVWKINQNREIEDE